MKSYKWTIYDVFELIASYLEGETFVINFSKDSVW